jgi:hypothetical protein
VARAGTHVSDLIDLESQLRKDLPIVRWLSEMTLVL